MSSSSQLENRLTYLSELRISETIRRIDWLKEHHDMILDDSYLPFLEDVKVEISLLDSWVEEVISSYSPASLKELSSDSLMIIKADNLFSFLGYDKIKKESVSKVKTRFRQIHKNLEGHLLDLDKNCLDLMAAIEDIGKKLSGDDMSLYSLDLFMKRIGKVKAKQERLEEGLDLIREEINYDAVLCAIENLRAFVSGYDPDREGINEDLNALLLNCYKDINGLTGYSIDDSFAISRKHNSMEEFSNALKEGAKGFAVDTADLDKAYPVDMDMMLVCNNIINYMKGVAKDKIVLTSSKDEGIDLFYFWAKRNGGPSEADGWYLEAANKILEGKGKVLIKGLDDAEARSVSLSVQYPSVDH